MPITCHPRPRRPEGRAAGAIVDTLRAEPQLTRADLIDRTGRSRSGVSAAVGTLLASGLLEEHAHRADLDVGGRVQTAARPIGPRSAGRPSSALSLASRAGLVAAVEVAADRMVVVVADLALRVLARSAATMDVAGSPEAALRLAAERVGSLAASVPVAPLAAVGLSVAAPVRVADGRVLPGSALAGWSGCRPAVDLGDRLGLPVLVDNDANLAALAELRLGAARGLRNALYLHVSSGIGGGLILDGQVHRGATGVAGEIGHVPVAAATAGGVAGGHCRCGGRHCLERVASGAALLATLRSSVGAELSADQLHQLPAADPVVRRALTDLGRLLGAAVADVGNSLNPRAVVLGGWVSHAAEPVLAGMRESLERRAHPGIAETMQLIPGALGSAAIITGALVLAALSAPVPAGDVRGPA